MSRKSAFFLGIRITRFLAKAAGTQPNCNAIVNHLRLGRSLALPI
jgi:hypothetical protein